jgi:hypothetical protein
MAKLLRHNTNLARGGRVKKPLTLALSLTLCAAPMVASGGELFGIINRDGVPFHGAKVKIVCPSVNVIEIRSTTDQHGSYRFQVGEAEDCRLEVRDPSTPLEMWKASVRAYTRPQRYNFEISGSRIQRR